MSISQLQKNNHLLLRAGFGPELSQFEKIETWKESEIRGVLFKNYPFQPLALKEEPIAVDYQNIKKMDSVTKKMVMQKNRKQIYQLNLSFLDQMVFSEDQLREKMAFFWHGHFATRTNNAAFNLSFSTPFEKKLWVISAIY